MLILFAKSQLALFDAPIHVGAHVRKDGTVVKPHIRIQKVAVKQRSLFGDHHAAAEPAKAPKRSKLHTFMTRHGGPEGLAAAIRGFSEHQQAALIEQMAKVGGVDVAEVRKLLGMDEGGGYANPVAEAKLAEREPLATGTETQKNGAVLVLGDPDKLVAYGAAHLDLGLVKFKRADNGIVLPKSKAELAEFFPGEREKLASGAYINHYADGGASLSNGKDVTGIARSVDDLKEIVAADWGPAKFRAVFGEDASESSKQSYDDQQTEIEARRKAAADNVAQDAQNVEQAKAKAEAEKVAQEKAADKAEAKRKAEIEATLHQGNAPGNPRYQAFLDTLEDPSSIGYGHGPYMGFIAKLSGQFEARHGLLHTDEKQKQFTQFVLNYADEHLSERIKAKRADDGPREGERNAEGLVFRDGRWLREEEEQAGTLALAMPDFQEGKNTSGVTDYYEKVAQRVIDMAAAGDVVGLEAIKAKGLTPNAKTGKVLNTWAGKTANSKLILDLHARAIAVAGGQPALEAEPAVATMPSASAPEIDKTKHNAVKLRAGGEKLLADSEAEYNRDRQSNTARRARMAASAEAAAAEQIRIAKTMLNLADAMEAGELVHLKGINTKAAVQTIDGEVKRAIIETDRKLSYVEQERNRGRNVTDDDIQNAKFPAPKWGTAGTSLSEVLEAIKGKRGAPALAATIRYSNGPTPEMAVALRKMLDVDKIKRLLGWWNIERLADMNRLQKLGITNAEQLQSAMREYVKYRGGLAKVDPVKAAERALVGQKVGVDFFPTPKTLAASMAEAAGIKAGMRVLEPSAGNGHLADAAKAAGADVDTVEISDTLRNILQAKGHNLVGRDFSSFETVVKYDAVLMNPPFSDRQDAAHIMRAWDLIKPRGKLVAIAGEGVFFGSDAQAQGFRNWLAEHGAEVEALPAGTFMGADLPAQTGANARLIKITKPDEQQAEPVDEATLKDVGLLREFGGRWKYKFTHDGSFFTANSKEDAIARASEAFRDAPEGALRTEQQRFDDANAAEYAEMHQRYGQMSVADLNAQYEKLGVDTRSLQAAGAREFDMNGGRRTSAAVAAEGARESAEERQKLGRYIDERRKREGGSADTGPKEGDVNAEGLVFRAGRWRREGREDGKKEAPKKEGKPSDSVTGEEIERAFAEPHMFDGGVQHVTPWMDEKFRGFIDHPADAMKRDEYTEDHAGNRHRVDGAREHNRVVAAFKVWQRQKAAPIEIDLAEDREDLATELIRNPHSDKAKAMLAAAAEKHAKAEAPTDDADDPTSPAYRYADTGYIAGARKEEAANLVIQRARRDGAQVLVQNIDWDELEQNPREAKELITKSNLFGQVPWEQLREKGMEPGAGFLIDRIYAAIGQEPDDDNAKARHDYTLGLQTLRDRLESCKTAQQVMGTLDELRAEYDGKVLNAEESAAYEKASEAIKPLYARLSAIGKESAEQRNRYYAAREEFGELTRKQDRRIQRGWKPDPEIAAKIEALRPEAEAAEQEWTEGQQKRNGEEREVRDQIRAISQLQERINLAAYARNKIENPLHRAWNTMGERFVNVLRYRSYKGSEAFQKHVTAAKTGMITDWSWAEKEGASKGPRVKKESARFQMRVADRFERVGGRKVDVVSTLALKSHFGLRDVQSGNWVLQDPVSAKFHTEHCAEAFADLADLIGIPDAQVSFNGRLAVAFGARGKGNTGFGGAAAAHYEPVHRVINMTKMKGGGSLAHEWFHAVDNLIKEAEGLGSASVDDFVTERPEILPPGPLRDALVALRTAMKEGEHQRATRHQYTAQDYRLAQHNLRNSSGGVATMVTGAADAGAALDALDTYFSRATVSPRTRKNSDAWRRIAIAWHGGNPDGGELVVKSGPKMSSFMLEAYSLDGDAKRFYHAQTKEMAARAFQAWVEDRMGEMGRRNDYLSSYADNKYHVDPIFGIEWKPFPEGAERDRINRAFDNLMSVMGSERVLAKALDMWGGL